MRMPELTDLIWLFEDPPTPMEPDLSWPLGLHTFRLTRGSRSVSFSLDPQAGEAYLMLYESDELLLSLGRLRTLSHLTVEKDALILHFAQGDLAPLTLRTHPVPSVTWPVRPAGSR
ncbi:hypothetical protein [Thermomonospora amylolytica]|uniref:hypothetical protein n=1 Tax=Thermomonospora amylolytica TaxID=1411117 RepID=UPI000E6B9FB3|nr:hypothetical protein [Thermomonospora amylolytica]